MAGPLFFPALAGLALSCACYAQPPAISQEGVRNLASNMPPSLPGGSLAPGSLFTIDGLRLAGPGSTPLVRVAGAGWTVEAHLISATAEHIEALLPPETPQGDAQLVVTREGLGSRPFAVHIAPAFGIFSRNGKGWGRGEIENAGAIANTPAAPAHPGAMATLVGTGLKTADAEVYVGGARARVLSQAPQAGRQGRLAIAFQLARNTPLGCHTPVLVKLGKAVSNTVTMSVAPKGRSCGEEPWPPALVLLARVMMKARLIAGVPVDFTEDIGAVLLPPTDAGANLPPVSELLPPVGTCTTYTGRWPTDFLALPAGEGRDTGARISIAGPKGTHDLKLSSGGFYTAKLGGGIPFGRSLDPPFLESGEYRISAPGGRDIAAWSAKATLNTTLETLLPTHADVIDRAKGATVIWAGAKPGEKVLVIAANIDPLSGGAGICLCLASGKANRWHVPALPLSNLPPSRNMAGMPLNYLLVATLPAGTLPGFGASGVAGGAVLFSTVRGRTIQYK